MITDMQNERRGYSLKTVAITSLTGILLGMSIVQGYYFYRWTQRLFPLEPDLEGGKCKYVISSNGQWEAMMFTPIDKVTTNNYVQIALFDRKKYRIQKRKGEADYSGLLPSYVKMSFPQNYSCSGAKFDQWPKISWNADSTRFTIEYQLFPDKKGRREPRVFTYDIVNNTFSLNAVVDCRSNIVSKQDLSLSGTNGDR